MSEKIIQKQFKRVETKYIVDKTVLEQLLADLEQHMVADDFAESTITNIYFDNENFDMIQDSIAKKHGKEKIRMRLYDKAPKDSSEAFLEIKKKLNGVGFKFRLTSNPVSVITYVSEGQSDDTTVDEKVTEELDLLRERYGKIVPKMYIYYDRVSYKGREDKKVRVTLDQNLTYRDHEVGYNQGKHGYPLLDANKVIMEIKVSNTKPAWLDELLTKYQIEEESFSKYGNAYKLTQARVMASQENQHA